MNVSEVKEILIKQGKKDQEILQEINEKGTTISRSKRFEQIISENTKLITQIFNEHGLITISEYGKEASMYAFLMVQHCDKTDLPFMQTYLDAMRKNLNDIKPEYFALLQDKVLVYQGKKQLYGTQIMLDKTTGHYICKPVSHPKGLNERRASLGLGSVEEYLRS